MRFWNSSVRASRLGGADRLGHGGRRRGRSHCVGFDGSAATPADVARGWRRPAARTASGGETAAIDAESSFVMAACNHFKGYATDGWTRLAS